MRKSQLLHVPKCHCSTRSTSGHVCRQLRRLHLLRAILGREVTYNAYSHEYSQPSLRSNSRKFGHSGPHLPLNPTYTRSRLDVTDNARIQTFRLHPRRFHHTAAAEDNEDEILEPPKATRLANDLEDLPELSSLTAKQDRAENQYTAFQPTETLQSLEPRCVKIIPHKESARSLREKFCSFLLNKNVGSILFVNKDPEILNLIQGTANVLRMTMTQDTDDNPILQKNDAMSTYCVLRVNSIWTDKNLLPLYSTSTQQTEDWARFDIVLHQSWQLWESTAAGMVAAMPLMNVMEVTLPSSSLRTSSRQILRVELSNKDLDIHLSQDFKTEESWLQEFPRLAETYSTQLVAKLELESKMLLRFQKAGPQEFLSRAWSKLGWGTLDYEDCLVDDLSVPKPFDLWRSQLRASKRGSVGKPQVWFNRKGARRLAIYSAVQEVYREMRDAVHREQIFLNEATSILTLVTGGEDLVADLASMETNLNKPLQPFHLSIDSLTLHMMLQTLKQARTYGLPDRYEASVNSNQPKLNQLSSERSTLQRDFEGGQRCCEQYVLQTGINPLKDIIATRKALPIMIPHIVTEIIKSMLSNDVVVISSATGSGKTTQVPQIILDHFINAGRGIECNILCTQPRRIAATSVARRVAYERNSPLGHAVGHHVRFDDRSPTLAGSITYATTGVTLKLLESNHMDTLSRYSHIILDEVHVRDLETDVLLTRLRDFLAGRKSNGIQCPKVILMSATIDTSFFERYFNDASSKIPLQSTSIHVPGSRYDVYTHSLESIVSELGRDFRTSIEQSIDAEQTRLFLKAQHITVPGHVDDRATYRGTNNMSTSEIKQQNEETDDELSFVPLDLIATVIRRISSTTSSGDILVFLPGLAEIERLNSILESDTSGLNDSSLFRIFKLHSAMYETNDEVFMPVPLDCRRIILATNIAETSLTLPDVVYVVDSGRSRINVHDPINQRNDFFLKWISKAEIAQRRGRAGRVRPGHYYALYSEAQFEQLEETLIPEIHRSDLTQLILCEEILSDNIWQNRSDDLYQGNLTRSALRSNIRPTEEFLLRVPSPVGRNVIQATVEELERVKALVRGSDGFVVSPLGKALSRLPLAPAGGKALVLGVLFQCMVPLLIMAVERQDMPLFGHPTARRQVAVVRTEYSGTTRNDRIATSRGFQAYSEADAYEKADLRQKNFIRDGSFFEMAAASSQIYDLFAEAGILPHRPRNSHKHSFSFLADNFKRHSENTGLLKALSLAMSGSRLAVWKFRHFRTKNAARVLIEPRSVNNFKRKPSNRETRDIREEGDLIAYDTMRVAPEEKYPWLYVTSRIPVLAAILFGDSVSLENDDTIVIDGWLRYVVNCRDKTLSSPAKIIFELRKALDRWLNIAFSNISLQPMHDEVGELSRFNSSFLEDDQLHRIFVEDLSLILAHEEQQTVVSIEKYEVDQQVDDNATPKQETADHHRQSLSASVLAGLREQMRNRISAKDNGKYSFEKDARIRQAVRSVSMDDGSSVPIRKTYPGRPPVQSTKSTTTMPHSPKSLRVT